MTDAFPRNQLGLAMGTNTMVAAVGLVIGPVLGGALVEISWQWVFWFNIPLGLAGTFWAWSVLNETERSEKVTDLDLLGTGPSSPASRASCSGSRAAGSRAGTTR